MTDSNNAIIAGPNYIDSTFETVEFYGGSWEASLPLQNLAEPLMILTARSTDASIENTKFFVDLGVRRDLLCSIVPEHNFSKQAYVKHKHTNELVFNTPLKLATAGTLGDTVLNVYNPSGQKFLLSPGDKIKIGNQETTVQDWASCRETVDSWVYQTAFYNVVPTLLNATFTEGTIDAPDGVSTIVRHGAEDDASFPNTNNFEDFVAGATLAEDAATGQHYVEFEDYGYLDTDGRIAASVYLKAGARSKARVEFLFFSGSSLSAYFDIDLSTGVTSNATGANGTQVTQTGSYYVGNGWWRCYMNLIAPDTNDGFQFFRLYLLNDSGSVSYAGEAGKQIYIWNPCHERGEFSGVHYRPYQLSFFSGVTPDATTSSDSMSIGIFPALEANQDADTEVRCVTPDGWQKEMEAVVDLAKVWRKGYEFGRLPFGHPSFWTGEISDEDAVGYKMPYAHVFDAPIAARYEIFEIEDANNADGYVELSRHYLTPGWQATFNLLYGSNIQWEADTQSVTSLGGVEFKNELSKKRVVRGEFADLEENEVMQFPFEIDRKVGETEQLFFIFNPNDEYNFHRNAFACTMRSLTSATWTSYNRMGKAIEVREV